MKVEDELSRCIIQLLLKEPFYAHFLGGVVRNITDEVPTAAVGVKNGRMNLFINEQFFLKELKTTSSRVAVVKHEALHVLLKHCFRLNNKNYDSQLFNIAADIVVNQFIGNWDLPKNAITLNSFPGIGLEANMTVEWYYEKLSKNGVNPEKYLQPSAIGDHSKWGSQMDSSVETELESMVIQAKNRTSSKDFGNVPDFIQRLVTEITDKRNTQIHWKRALQIFSASSRKTRIYHSMKRVSKRYGTRPGIKIIRHQKLVVAIDTSGSIQDEHLNLFFSEIHGIWKQGAEIQIIECDTEVKRVYPYTGKKTKHVQGGGGTNFDPVFQHLVNTRSEQFDGCIYLTDGYAPKPTIKPPCKVFWVITSDGTMDNLTFGRSVKLS